MRINKPDDGKTIGFTGSVVVDGICCEVRLEVNTVDLILQLGAKAARSAGGKTVEAGGLVKVTVSKKYRDQVHTAVAARRRARTYPMSRKIKGGTLTMLDDEGLFSVNVFKDGPQEEYGPNGMWVSGRSFETEAAARDYFKFCFDSMQ